MTAPACSRRLFLAALAAPLARPALAMPVAEAFPAKVTLMVAGPEGGGLDRAARILAGGLAAHLPPRTDLTRSAVGGLDGVTGANEFAALASPDGGTALLLPGAASLAWLAGDSRVHFDPSRWLPILARTNPAFVVGRTDGAAIAPGARIRVAAGGPVSPALAAMLAVDLLGADVHAVYGLGDDTAALAALRQGRVDAILVRGAARLDAALAANPGVKAHFTFGTDGGGGTVTRDVLAPAVPTLAEYTATFGRKLPGGPKYDAWWSSASAAQLQYALVLPGLIPPSVAALWREAGAQAMAPDLAQSADMRFDSAAAMLLRSMCPGGAALLQLRGWLAERLGWQPG